LPKRRRAYYADALRALAAAKRGSVLRFESSKAEAGLQNSAKKLGYSLMFAMDGNELLVQIVDTGDDK
jgi:hypothetical protein